MFLLVMEYLFDWFIIAYINGICGTKLDNIARLQKGP